MNTLNCFKKTLSFTYEGQGFIIDLTEGDLHDSWNGITLNDGTVKDFNFSWQEGEEPAAALYATYWEDDTLKTDHSDYFTINIQKVIGSYENYFDTTPKYARKCSVTGKGMNKGFCFGDGGFYCIKKKHAKKYAKSLGYKNLKKAYKDGAYYWTEWEIDLDDEWYDKLGNKFTTCHKCEHETQVVEGFNFCTNCLTHL